MEQEKIDNSISHLNSKISELQYEIQEMREEISKLNSKARDLNDPHALIPKEYATIEEWLDGHPFPSSVNSMRCKNKMEAYDINLSCHTYQDSYHIVRIN